MRECGRATGPVGMVLATLIMLGGASCAHGPGDPEVSEVRNFGVVKQGVLYRGADPDGLALNQLRTSRYKVKTIVNLNVLDDDLTQIDTEDLKYIHLPICPVPFVRIGGDEKQIQRFLAIVRDPQNQPVFVHSTKGSNRTGEAVGAYEILDMDKPIEDVERELSEHNYCHLMFPYIRSYLRDLSARTVETVPVAPAEPATQPASQPAP